MKKTLIALSLFAISGIASAQTPVFTPPVEVRSVETLTESEFTFIRSANGGWGHVDCPDAEFVNISGEDGPSYNAQLAIALTAQASGGSVQAFGICSTSGQVVIAERIRLL